MFFFPPCSIDDALGLLIYLGVFVRKWAEETSAAHVDSDSYIDLLFFVRLAVKLWIEMHVHSEKW